MPGKQNKGKGEGDLGGRWFILCNFVVRSSGIGVV